VYDATLAERRVESWACAFRSSRIKKNTLYVSLCCFINWVNPEKLAELVPQAELAYSTVTVERKLMHYVAASIPLSHLHLNLPGRQRYNFARIQVVRMGGGGGEVVHMHGYIVEIMLFFLIMSCCVF
jgi:hypothetical protein